MECHLAGGSSISATPAPVLDLQAVLNQAAGADPCNMVSQTLQQATADARVVGGSTSSGRTEGCSMGGQVVVCSTDGTVTLLELQRDQIIEQPATLLDDEEQQTLQAGSCTAVVRQSVVLPGEVFSSPVVLGGLLVLGCRDDFLYCIKHSGA